MSVEIGTAYVSVIPGAKGFAKTLRRELEREFAQADFDSLIDRTFGDRAPVALPVRPEIDPKDVPTELPRQTRKPKLPVTLDPLFAAFQAEVKRQTAQLAREVSIRVPATADTAGLRSRVSAEIQQIESQLSADIPTEPAGRREYEAKLRALVAGVERNIKADIRVNLDTAGATRAKGAVGAIGGALKALGGIAAGAFGVITDGMTRSSSNAVRFGGAVAGALTTAAGPAGMVAAALAGVAAAAVALSVAATLASPALGALAGALAAIPGIAVGAGAALATLALGLSGISDAFKPASGGGGGGGGGIDLATQARQVAQATRGVESAQRALIRAQRDARAAQLGINAAIAEEIERREDLDRAVRGAALDKQDAALRQEEALRELNAALETGDIPTIQRAKLAYAQAQLGVEAAADAADDLGKEQAKASKTTVKNSDIVQAAYQRQIDASDALKAATDQLASANESLQAAQNPPGGGGGGGGIGAQMTKIAPAAQAFVDAVKALKPAFDDLRLSVQQRLFKGLDKTITRIGEKWLPALKPILGRYADAFNTFFKDLGGAITTPKFMDSIAVAAEAGSTALGKIGKSITKSLTPAFGALAKASKPFIEGLGDELADVVTTFSDWVLAGEKSGDLQDFFDKATQAMHDIFDIGEDVARIIGSIIEIIIGENLDAGARSPLESFKAGLDSLATWLEDPKNQKMITDFFEDVGKAIDDVGYYVSKIDGWLTDISEFADAVGLILKGIDPTTGETLGADLWEGIKKGFGDAAAATGDFFAKLLWKGPKSLIGRIKSGLGIASPSKLTAKMGKDLINGLINGVKVRFTNLARTVARIPVIVMRAIGSLATTFLQKGRDLITGLINGIGGRTQSLANKVSSLVGTIRNNIGSVAGTLYNSGRSVVQGLIDGINSKYGSLASAMGSLVGGAIPGIVSRVLQINSPSKVMARLGESVPEGLALGIETGTPLVVGASAGMADAAVPQLKSLPRLVNSPINGLQVGATTGQPALDWARTATGSKLLDAIRAEIKVVYHGDATAALGSR